MIFWRTRTQDLILCGSAQLLTNTSVHEHKCRPTLLFINTTDNKHNCVNQWSTMLWYPTAVNTITVPIINHWLDCSQPNSDSKVIISYHLFLFCNGNNNLLSLSFFRLYNFQFSVLYLHCQQRSILLQWFCS